MTKSRSLRLPVLVYECDQCGACCQKSILEAELCDALREPKLIERGRMLNKHMSLIDQKIGLNRPSAEGFGCVFLDADKRCEIYNSRPEMCVSFQAGSQKCQDRRRSVGLERLTPVRVNKPTILQQIHALGRGED